MPLWEWEEVQEVLQRIVTEDSRIFDACHSPGLDIRTGFALADRVWIVSAMCPRLLLAAAIHTCMAAVVRLRYKSNGAVATFHLHL